MKKVLVGMSGGVDSAVAAYLLKEAGYEVAGLTLRTWEPDDGTVSRCCEIDDARETAWKLGIRYYTLDCTSAFQDQVIRPFVSSYVCGRTPNPCIECNRYVKWAEMLYMAKALRADYVATGHYASVIQLDNGRYTVKVASHAQKDQTYMLWKLTQEQLKATKMPLGGYTKEEVRRIAEAAGIPVAKKRDSQEICFVPDGDYAGFVCRNAEESASGTGEENSLREDGYFVDEEGRRLGRHKGIIHYTIGQRRGLGLAMGHHVYVNSIRPETNEVVIGEEASLYNRTVICEDVNFMGIEGLAPGETVRVKAKIRYHHPAQDAVLERTSEGEVRLLFDEPVRAAAPGQSAVFYDEQGCVAGGGIIRDVIREE